jgi:adenylosuccinate synthase
MPLDIVIGTQWGDEGKGRFVDLFSAEADVVARYNGGDNAGHTVTTGKRAFKLHLIPSGIIHPHTTAIMAGGMVINLAALYQEIRMLSDANIPVSPNRLVISYAAHLITPAHRALDRAREASRGNAQIGTTGRGIGPAYEDKIIRSGLRVEEMLDLTSFRRRLREHVTNANHLLEELYHVNGLDIDQIVDEYCSYAEQFSKYVGDTRSLVLDALAKEKEVLAEGAQGTLLDIDGGTYPFVTSSNCTAAAALIGLGIGVQPVRRIIGVTKAFQTRVGSGPFPTELLGEEAQRLRGSGDNPWDEYGTTTGRPRRVGWLDGVLLRYAVQVNNLTELAVTKLDILSGFDEVKICTAYFSKGESFSKPPMGVGHLEQFQPVYETLPGWNEDIRDIRKQSDLPPSAQTFLQRIEEISGVPVHWVSVGPEREQVIHVEK